MKDKLNDLTDKLEKIVTEKSEKVMTNNKVEGLINNTGGVLCFVGAILFGIMFIACGASLMKTGKNYVVKPGDEVAASEEAGDEEMEATEEDSDEEDEDE